MTSLLTCILLWLPCVQRLSAAAGHRQPAGRTVSQAALLCAEPAQITHSEVHLGSLVPAHTEVSVRGHTGISQRCHCCIQLEVSRPACQQQAASPLQIWTAF